MSTDDNASTTTGPTTRSWPWGTAVVVAGSTGTDEGVAVWRISAMDESPGQPVGANVVSLEAACRPDDAARLLSIVERRALVTTADGRMDEILAALTRSAGIDRDAWWQGQVLDPAAILTDIIEHRKRYEQTDPSITWRRDLATEAAAVSTVEDVRDLAGIAPAGGTVTSAALTMVAVLRWLLGCWGETERAKARQVVRAAHGVPVVFAPVWQDAMRAASGTRLPLSPASAPGA